MATLSLSASELALLAKAVTELNPIAGKIVEGLQSLDLKFTPDGGATVIPLSIDVTA